MLALLLCVIRLDLLHGRVFRLETISVLNVRQLFRVITQTRCARVCTKQTVVITPPAHPCWPNDVFPRPHLIHKTLNGALQGEQCKMSTRYCTPDTQINFLKSVLRFPLCAKWPKWIASHSFSLLLPLLLLLLWQSHSCKNVNKVSH